MMINITELSTGTGVTVLGLVGSPATGTRTGSRAAVWVCGTLLDGTVTPTGRQGDGDVVGQVGLLLSTLSVGTGPGMPVPEALA